MARRLTSLLLLLTCTLCSAQPFGRFGYSPVTAVPGLALSPQGFKVNCPGSDQFFYESAYSGWKAVSVTDTAALVSVSAQGQSPTRLRFNLLSPGFALYFPSGFRFRLHSTQSPFLTWADGSVGADVPTAPTDWALISFHDAQPPVLISFPGAKSAVQISGAPGNWVVRSVQLDPVWVHISTPTGIKPFATTGAAELGRLLAEVKPTLESWLGREPQLKTLTFKEEPTAVTATWTFDGPGILIPPAPLLAKIGGYNAAIQSDVVTTEAYSEVGPYAFCKGNELRVRFPAQQAMAGRSLAVGPGSTGPPGGKGAIPLAVSLAFANMLGSSDRGVRDRVKAEISAFLAAMPSVEEPYTGQQLPYGPDGAGCDLVAAEALLMQSDISSRPGSQEPNPMLLSLRLKRDWLTWQIWAQDADVRRRATALNSVASLFRPEASARFEAGLLQAGLAGERGLHVWLRHRGLENSSATLLEAMPLARSFLFFANPNGPTAPFDALLSPVRVISDLPINVVRVGADIQVSWYLQDERPGDFYILSSLPLNFKKGVNLDRLTIERLVDCYKVHFEPHDVGQCSLLMTTPKATALPQLADPGYSEIRQ